MTRNKPRTLAIGSYSHATMRPEDLVPCFLSIADDLRLSKADRKTVQDIRKRSDAEIHLFNPDTDDQGKESLYCADCGASETDHTESEEYYDSEDCHEDLSTLFDLLESYCPDYCYFGSHPGDGSDYGVWPVEDLLQDTSQGSYDGCVWRSDKTPHEHYQAMRTGDSNGVLYDRDDRQTLADEWIKARQMSHWLYVNDHGNATLYRRAGNRWVEVWSVV